ncbi:MAG TPA: hypothetical protein VGD43_12535 [Micromonospora sp.]
MNRNRNLSRPFTARSIAKAGVLGLLAAGAIGIGLNTPALAGGTSTSSYNCYTQWWNTAWAQKCGGSGAAVVGWYRSDAYCSYEADKWLEKYRLPGSTATYSGTSCTFSVTGGRLTYLGY